MSIVEVRRQAVTSVSDKILEIVGDEPSVEKLQRSALELSALAERADLFSADDFPLPGAETTGGRTFLIYEREGAALYAVSSVPGKSYRPHDHGGSWVVISAVTGREQHRFYSADPNDPAALSEQAVIICEPGTPVSMMPNGIHAIEGVGDGPLLHLHFYGTRLQDQKERTEYDLENGTTEGLVLTSFGHIQDKR